MPKKFRKENVKGNALLEFALTLPVLILVIAGMIDLSLLFYDKGVITNASREGARYGIVFRSPSYASVAEVQAYTLNYCQDNLITFASTPATPVVTATPSNNPPTTGDTLKVTVSYNYSDILLHNFISHSQIYNLTASTTMTYE